MEDQTMTTKEGTGSLFWGLRGFIGESEARAIRSAMRGEESEHFRELVKHWAQVITAMPKTYETDGQGDAAVVHLHYFKSGADWYIVEKDAGTPHDLGQHQAFGWADLGYGGELGYISIAELIANGAELDLYWRPVPLRAIKERAAVA